MEKIQQALERARRARTIALKRRQQGRWQGGAELDELKIEYEQTRVVPAAPEALRRSRIIAGHDDEPSFESFRILRTQVLGRLEAIGGNAIAVCGASQGEGKTLVAVNLAVSLARQVNRTALLVDLDLRNPSVHRCFGLQPTLGISDHLAGEAPLSACLINPGIERLVLLPQITRVADSSELLATPRMAALARELKERYPDRIVVFDCPPLLMTNDPLIIMDYADGCLLVIQEGRTRRPQVERAIELIGEDRFLGSVLNNARMGPASEHYYGYGYGYGHKHANGWFRRGLR
ncbi:MAG: AAA family ATPase [Geminicoccaceae bacterium]|nr:AAA family ATPase [Geminicoccaceae bacterium]